MEKIKTTVRIAGHEYTIVGTDAPEYIQRVAAYVDRRIADLSVTSRLPIATVSVLTAMNLADELMKAQDENQRLRRQLAVKAG